MIIARIVTKVIFFITEEFVIVLIRRRDSKGLPIQYNFIPLQFIKTNTIKRILVLIAIAISGRAFAQGGVGISYTQTTELPETKVDTMPSFVGGNDSLGKFIQRNMKYPERAKRMVLQERVIQVLLLKRMEVLEK